MKKIIFFFSVVLILTGCSRSSKLEGDVENNNYSTHAIHSDSIEEGSKLIYLTEQTDNNLISIEVPVFDINKSNIIESDIINYIKNYLYDITGVKFSLIKSNTNALEDSNNDVAELITQYDYYIDINHKITIQNENCISIVFEGMLNKSTAVHPMHLFFTYNINPETGERILFSDRYRINSNLYNIVSLYVKDNIVGDSNNGVVVETLLDENTFFNELSSEKSVFCYYTEDSVGISFPVVFSMGSHLEVEIPYDSLEVK